MRVSAKADYAVRAVIEIARGQDHHLVTSEDIANAQGIPRTFLLSILADLRRAGLVASRRGQSGGWTLQRRPEAITVADVIRAVDGPLASVQGLRPERVVYPAGTALLQTVWVAVRASLRDVLEVVTVEDLVAGSLPASVADRAASDDAWRSH